MGQIGQAAGACVSGRCRHALLAGGGFEGIVPPPPVRVSGPPRVPLAACPRRSVCPVADRPPDPREEAADKLDALFVAWWGPVWSAACLARSAGVRIVGMCARLVRGL